MSAYGFAGDRIDAGDRVYLPPNAAAGIRRRLRAPVHVVASAGDVVRPPATSCGLRDEAGAWAVTTEAVTCIRCAATRAAALEAAP